MCCCPQLVIVYNFKTLVCARFQEKYTFLLVASFMTYMHKGRPWQINYGNDLFRSIQMLPTEFSFTNFRVATNKISISIGYVQLFVH